MGVHNKWGEEMSEVIDGNKLAHSIHDKLCDHLYCRDCSMNINGECKVEKWLDDAPTIDAVSMVHGEWMPIIEANEFGEVYQVGIYCSECGETLVCEANFCPNCGAKMFAKDINVPNKKGADDDNT